MKFRAGPTGSGISHLPEVILLAAPHNPGGRDPGLLPQLVRFVVVSEDRHPHPILRQAERLSQKLPAKLDGVYLKVVAKGKVPQHFKERMVAAGIADILQIVVLAPCTETLLHGDRSPVGARFLAEKYPLKLVHPGIGEEQRGIGLRNQGGTRHDLMAMLFKISNEGLSQFLSAVLHTTLTFLPHQRPHHRLNGVFVKPALAQESRYSATRLRRVGPSSHRDHLHGQIPFTYLAVGSPQRRMHDVFRTTSGEQLFLQARTPHRHACESPIGPPRSEGYIVEVSQRRQPSNRRANLRRRCPLRREHPFDLRRRAITTT